MASFSLFHSLLPCFTNCCSQLLPFPATEGQKLTPHWLCLICGPYVYDRNHHKSSDLTQCRSVGHWKQPSACSPTKTLLAPHSTFLRQESDTNPLEEHNKHYKWVYLISLNKLEVKGRYSGGRGGGGGGTLTDINSSFQSLLTGFSPSWLFRISDEDDEYQSSNLSLSTCFEISGGYFVSQLTSFLISNSSWCLSRIQLYPQYIVTNGVF